MAFKRPSRACRSIEVSVQARWIEHFEATSSTRHCRTVLFEAVSNFGWMEKELRNKMAIWHGFDNESMQRLRNLRPALEVAADTMNPTWRRLLSVVSKPSEKATYLQWDPHFNYRHINDSDPRWMPSEAPLTWVSSLFVCETCSNEQSDDPKVNCYYCSPSWFSYTTITPPPIQVFRTPDGRNNSLMALCAFERGAAVGEFIGVITKGLQDVDYRLFTWLDTQRIILVSKGIDAGSDIAVNYSDKYWKGRDKKCLCGERSRRYRRDR
ncbi:hypothetical protein EV127DRAFT_456144 [Xylaria flabelliformis]|nr:hypothetical protein EV127DRAFT_456144 [Xylaria flabelliformis]